MLLNFSTFSEVFLEQCSMVLKIKLRCNRKGEICGMVDSGLAGERLLIIE